MGLPGGKHTNKSHDVIENSHRPTVARRLARVALPQAKMKDQSRQVIETKKRSLWASPSEANDGKESQATAPQNVADGQGTDSHGDPTLASGAPVSKKMKNGETKPSDYLESTT